jgi:hypothetical protein
MSGVGSVWTRQIAECVERFIRDVFVPYEVLAFRIHDGSSEVHRWSLPNKIRRDRKAAHS